MIVWLNLKKVEHTEPPEPRARPVVRHRPTPQQPHKTQLHYLENNEGCACIMYEHRMFTNIKNRGGSVGKAISLQLGATKWGPSLADLKY